MRMARQESSGTIRVGWGCVAAVMALLAAPGAQAKPGQGSIVGKVFNQTSGVTLPGALVQVESIAGEAVTDANGRYAIGDVPVGTYRIIVTFPGFGAAIRTDVAIDADRETNIDVGLVEMPTLAE